MPRKEYMLGCWLARRTLRLGTAVLVAAFLATPLRCASSTANDFAYVGGTENLQYHCEGELQVAPSSMTFRCAAGAVTIPFDSITHMEYRPKVSATVRKMKLRWTAKPAGSGGKKNRFFTVLYKQGDRVHAVVLQVSPDDMRPYLAVLELHTGKRIAVWDYRGFD
jgi:hypothetical protein